MRATHSTTHAHACTHIHRRVTSHAHFQLEVTDDELSEDDLSHASSHPPEVACARLSLPVSCSPAHTVSLACEGECDACLAALSLRVSAMHVCSLFEGECGVCLAALSLCACSLSLCLLSPFGWDCQLVLCQPVFSFNSVTQKTGSLAKEVGLQNKDTECYSLSKQTHLVCQEKIKS